MTQLLCLWMALSAGVPPPLTDLLRAARRNNHDLGLSRAQLEEQQAAVQQALSTLTPTLQIGGSYTRNQYDAVIAFPNALLGTSPAGGTTSVAIQPYDTWIGTVGLSVPLFSATNLYRRGEASLLRDSATSALQATDAEVLLATARGYYQVIGAQGVEQAAERALETAGESLRVTATRFAAGTANKLAVDRARVDVATAQQTVATARQSLALAIRNLETLSGEKLTAPLPTPDEPPTRAGTEPDYLREAEARRPELAQAKASLAQQETTVKEAWALLAPSLSANAQEHFTNATGFVNQSAYWTAGVALAWTLDPVGTPASVRRAQASVEEQRQRLARQLDLVRDDVHTSWLAVEADEARLAEATSAAESAREAVTITQAQNQAGTATSLDVSQAQRDAFNAEATLAQTRADLAAAALALQTAAGEPLLTDARTEGQP